MLTCITWCYVDSAVVQSNTLQSFGQPLSAAALPKADVLAALKQAAKINEVDVTAEIAKQTKGKIEPSPAKGGGTPSFAPAPFAPPVGISKGANPKVPGNTSLGPKDKALVQQTIEQSLSKGKSSTKPAKAEPVPAPAKKTSNVKEAKKPKEEEKPSPKKAAPKKKKKEEEEESEEHDEEDEDDEEDEEYNDEEHDEDDDEDDEEDEEEH